MIRWGRRPGGGEPVEVDVPDSAGLCIARWFSAADGLADFVGGGARVLSALDAGDGPALARLARGARDDDEARLCADRWQEVGAL